MGRGESSPTRGFSPCGRRQCPWDEVEKTCQSAYEPEASFSCRFREVADAAYPTDARNEEQNRIFIRAFARGLRSDELARKLVEEGNPTSLEDAFETLAGYSARKDAYARLSRHEEPMEVAPVNPAPPLPQVAPESTTTVSLLKKVLQSRERLQTKVAKLEAQTVPRSAPAAPLARPTYRDGRQGQPRSSPRDRGSPRDTTTNWTPEGKPRCFQCGCVGHMRAAKISRETDSGRRSNLRSTSGRSAGRRSEHRCVGGHRCLLHAPTTRHFS